MKIVIVGADAAGMSAASQAKRLNPKAQVLVLEKTGDVSYGACGLPYKLLDNQNVEDLQVISPADFRDKRGIDLRLGHEVVGIDREKSEVYGRNDTGSFKETYDKLLIATGAEVNVPPIPGLGQLMYDKAWPLKTLQDGRFWKAALREKPQRAVIIGGGYIGLEAADNLRTQGLEVTLVEALPDVMLRLPAEFRARIHETAEGKGVIIKTNARVTRMEKDVDRVVHINVGDEELLADIVLLATGITPASKIAEKAGLELNPRGAITVNEFLQTSDVNIYSAGDCADAVHLVTGNSTWIPLALRANRAGKTAGANMCGKQQKIPPVAGTAAFLFFDQEIAMTGLSEEEAGIAGFDPISVAIKSATKAHYMPGHEKLLAWLLADKTTGRILGGALMGSDGAAHRIDTIATALATEMTVEQLYDLDLMYAPPFGPSWSPFLIAASALNRVISNSDHPR